MDNFGGSFFSLSQAGNVILTVQAEQTEGWEMESHA